MNRLPNVGVDAPAREAHYRRWILTSDTRKPFCGGPARADESAHCLLSHPAKRSRCGIQSYQNGTCKRWGANTALPSIAKPADLARSAFAHATELLDPGGRRTHTDRPCPQKIEPPAVRRCRHPHRRSPASFRRSAWSPGPRCFVGTGPDPDRWQHSGGVSIDGE